MVESSFFSCSVRVTDAPSFCTSNFMVSLLRGISIAARAYSEHLQTGCEALIHTGSACGTGLDLQVIECICAGSREADTYARAACFTNIPRGEKEVKVQVDRDIEGLSWSVRWSRASGGREEARHLLRTDAQLSAVRHQCRDAVIEGIGNDGDGLIRRRSVTAPAR